MSIQVLPTAPSPTVTHLMNFEALEAIDLSTHTHTKQEQEETRTRRRNRERER